MDNEKFPEQAYGLVFFNNQWGIMELRFATTGEVSPEMVFTPAGADKAEAIERYKMKSANLFY